MFQNIPSRNIINDGLIIFKMEYVILLFRKVQFNEKY